MDIIQEARRVFDTEIAALQATKSSLGDDFETIVQLIMQCRGKVVISGMGKSGHIGTKVAASLASLGTPSFFMHPGEAMHGDLGMVTEKDVVILMSHSGESNEVVQLLPTLHEIHCPTIAITSNPKSTLAKGCQYHFYFPQFEEACYMHLAPTSSTTAQLVLGDALAVVTSKLRNYTKKDYALHHPAGTLGKKLLVKVQDIMHAGNENAVIPENSTLRSAIIEMSSKGLSMVTIVDSDTKLKGIITDGDLRRMLEHGVDVYNEIVDHVMTKSPKWIDQMDMAVNALQKMSDLRITSMPVLNESKQVVGSILMQDIYKTGIVE